VTISAALPLEGTRFTSRSVL